MNTTKCLRYPRAEWEPAATILMHTPGQELFDGVIHPYAGLFEHYFDVEAAANEHRNYIKALEKNGITVYTVEGILHNIDIDVLRQLAEKTLKYDFSQLDSAEMAPKMEKYRQETLAAMTRDDLIRCLLFQPTVKLRPAENNTKIEAQYLRQSLMNLYFTRDQSVTTPRGHVICKMNSVQRAPETRIIRACYDYLGLAPILEISGEGRLEGGDYIPAGTMSFIGCGMRTNREAIRQMMAADAFGHDAVAVVVDHKWWQMQMHLDTYFNVIDKDLCTMVESRLYAQPDEPEYVTVDLYERQDDGQYALAASDISFVDFLKEKGFEIIPIQQTDEMHYANNFLTIAPRHIMAVGGQSGKLQQDLAAHGVEVEWMPLDNLISGYGAAHCMTQVLKRISC